jgi:hypothetical protein
MSHLKRIGALALLGAFSMVCGGVGAVVAVTQVPAVQSALRGQMGPAGPAGEPGETGPAGLPGPAGPSSLEELSGALVIADFSCPAGAGFSGEEVVTDVRLNPGVANFNGVGNLFDPTLRTTKLTLCKIP